MPFLRRYGAFRRRFARKRPVFRKSLRKRVLRLSKKVGSEIKANTMYQVTSTVSGSSSGLITSTHNSTGSTSSNGVVLITGLAQAVTAAGRQGNFVRFLKMKVKGLTYNGAAQTTGSGGTLPTLYRVIFFSVRANAGESLGVGSSDPTTFITDFTTGGLSSCLGPFRAEIVPSRVRIIKDMIINPFPVNQTTSGLLAAGAQRKWSFTVDLAKHFRGQGSTYNGTGAGNTACEMNHVYACFLQNMATPGDPGSAISVWTVQLSFLP